MSTPRGNIKMTSSKVSTMVLFLFLLLVFPNIDSALGTQMESRKLKETYHPDHVTVQGRRLPFPFPRPTPRLPFPIPRPIPRPPRLPRRLRRAPPPPKAFEATYEPGH